MKICSECGEKLDNSSNFCPKCGKEYKEQVTEKKSLPMKVLEFALEAVLIIFSLDD